MTTTREALDARIHVLLDEVSSLLEVVLDRDNAAHQVPIRYALMFIAPPDMYGEARTGIASNVPASMLHVVFRAVMAAKKEEAL